MILHAAAMVAVLANQATAPLWKYLLQIAQIIIPVAGGVLIAWIAFCWNSKKEHKHWIRDQELGEWRELISVVASVEDLIPVLIDEELDLDALKQAILRVIPYLRNRLFINEDLREIGFGEEWNELLKFALSDLTNAKNSLDNRRTHSATNLTDTKIESAYQELKKANVEIRNRYGKLQEKLQQTSRKCLRTQASARLGHKKLPRKLSYDDPEAKL